MSAPANMPAPGKTAAPAPAPVSTAPPAPGAQAILAVRPKNPPKPKTNKTHKIGLKVPNFGELEFTGDPVSVRVRCHTCRWESVDHHPRFLTVLGQYVTRQMKCDLCTEKNDGKLFAKQFWPVEPDKLDLVKYLLVIQPLSKL